MLLRRALTDVGSSPGSCGRHERGGITDVASGTSPCPHTDPAKVWTTRRGRRLLGTTSPSDIDELLVDASGRLVALLASPGDRGTGYRAEWPIGLPADLTDDSVIAADRGEGNSHGPVVALTRTPAGWRADPVPAPPDQRGYGGFNWGYRGTGPGALYDALLRIGLHDPLGPGRYFRPAADSDLWTTITSTTGPLRINVGDLRRWAAHDIEQGHDQEER